MLRGGESGAAGSCWNGEWVESMDDGGCVNVSHIQTLRKCIWEKRKNRKIYWNFENKGNKYTKGCRCRHNTFQFLFKSESGSGSEFFWVTIILIFVFQGNGIVWNFPIYTIFNRIFFSNRFFPALFLLLLPFFLEKRRRRRRQRRLKRIKSFPPSIAEETMIAQIHPQFANVFCLTFDKKL